MPREDRTYWKANGEEREIVPLEQANLVSSQLTNGRHSPVLDIDFEAQLIPSSTPGHYHLYLDGIEMDWEVYEDLLRALAKAGLIQEGYAKMQIPRGATFVRLPGQMKANGDGLNDSGEPVEPVVRGENA